ncbi:MAG: tRNA-(ms[2]io[6]A)-hydroxylase [Saprospiraceae bacterium]|nr:tRNA-(ms[2]io[6]A)-hydroxylase [Candidatus Parvibacillus calidus]MBX2936336.1 tRNA-(ms[2]io[6]A)-hydroxylase [Saprospiraceae bacterium]MCB0592212.1 tRNA-(ms[2]io[6]A)-hydroxylase [Saprospiraceae bacterium]MCO5283169.1 tRNA-(ms[2]io[6]A)-hydroxylase [Saprospiraceae bacterium]WKZ63259.1 MAG: tRNA-(ms[2]io[6]A)-hydroxylase [Saprospiraceae bacterium]
MLGLKLPTDPRWADLTAISTEAILTDHAYCEQKAALSMISLIQQYPEEQNLVEELAPVVTEEWGHFRSVLAMLKKRGLSLGPQRRDEYVNQLKKFEIHGGSRQSQLIEKLLICALIEARSCERFRILSLHHPDEELRNFYHKFMVSEAGHYRMFIDLAYSYGEKEAVKTRWQEYLNREAEIMHELELRGDRVH